MDLVAFGGPKAAWELQNEKKKENRVPRYATAFEGLVHLTNKGLLEKQPVRAALGPKPLQPYGLSLAGLIVVLHRHHELMSTSASSSELDELLNANKSLCPEIFPRWSHLCNANKETALHQLRMAVSSLESGIEIWDRRPDLAVRERPERAHESRLVRDPFGGLSDYISVKDAFIRVFFIPTGRSSLSREKSEALWLQTVCKDKEVGGLVRAFILERVRGSMASVRSFLVLASLLGLVEREPFEAAIKEWSLSLLQSNGSGGN